VTQGEKELTPIARLSTSWADYFAPWKAWLRVFGLVTFLAEFHLMNSMSDYSRIGDYLDPFQASRFIPAFFEKICLDHYRRDLSLSGRNAFGAATEVRSRELLRFSECS